MSNELVFGTHAGWQIALVRQGRDVIASFYDSLDNPNLLGAIATAQVTAANTTRLFLQLPDGETGYAEAREGLQPGDKVAVRVSRYVQSPKAWPVKLLPEAPAGTVQWHDAATSVVNHASTLYGLDPMQMRQDDDAVVDFMASHTGIVELKDGARLIIEQTSALTTIDLDSGKLHGVSNFIAEFGPAISAALARYNLGGAIVIDAQFLGSTARKGLGEKIVQGLANDPLKPKVVSVTRMGLIELTRPRMGPSRLQVQI